MRSKRIVIATIGSLGDLHPAICLALELKKRGCQTTLATSPVYQQKGRTITRKKYRQDRAAKELQRLLDNPQYKTKALEIAQIVRAENGVKIACDEIETFLNSSLYGGRNKNSDR